MSIEGCGVELSEDVDLGDARVDAVGHGDVDEAIGAADGDGRLGAVFGERVQTGASTATENDSCRE